MNIGKYAQKLAGRAIGALAASALATTLSIAAAPAAPAPRALSVPAATSGASATKANVTKLKNRKTYKVKIAGKKRKVHFVQEGVGKYDECEATFAKFYIGSKAVLSADSCGLHDLYLAKVNSKKSLLVRIDDQGGDHESNIRVYSMSAKKVTRILKIADFIYDIRVKKAGANTLTFTWTDGDDDYTRTYKYASGKLTLKK